MHLAKPPAWLRAAWDNIDDLEQLVAARGPHIRHGSTHCPRGHLRGVDATRGDGACRICANERSRAAHARAARAGAA